MDVCGAAEAPKASMEDDNIKTHAAVNKVWRFII